MRHRQIVEALLAQAKALELVARAIAAEDPAPVTAAEVYTSSRRGPHPPGKSLDWTRKHLKEVPGAYRAGRDWCVTADDFRAWARARDVARVRATGQPTPDVNAAVAAALAEANLRKAG